MRRTADRPDAARARPRRVRRATRRPPPTPDRQPAETTGSPAAAPTAYDDYVALGDSYTAAPLVPPTDTEQRLPALERQLPGPGRRGDAGHRARRRQLLGRGHGRPRRSPQQGGTGAVPPQFDALTADTDLVTLGLGGNDVGLFGSADRPVHPAAHRRTRPAVRARPSSAAGVDDRRSTQIRRNVAARRRGRPRARSPGPDPGGRLPADRPASRAPAQTCRSAEGDYAYVREVSQGLDRRAQHGGRGDGQARRTSTCWTPSEGHDICAGDDRGSTAGHPDLTGRWPSTRSPPSSRPSPTWSLAALR